MTVRNTAATELRIGWPIIVAAMTGVLIGLTGIPYYTFGTFLKPLAAEFGWTRSQVSLGVLFLHAGTFVTSPFMGRFVDKHGARRVALTSLVGLAIGFLALAASGPSLRSYYGAWLLLALLGCGTTPLTWTRMVNLHFRDARGLALGLALAGTGVASIVGPQLCGVLIAGLGWRAAYIGLAALVLVVALPIVAIASGAVARAKAVAVAETAGLTLAEAAKTRVFWSILLAIFLVIVAQASAMVHLVPLLTDRGLSPAKAGGLMGLLGLMVVAGRIVCGALVDRFFAPFVGGAFLLLPAIGLLLLAGTAGTGGVLVAIALLGLAAGAEVDLLSYLVSRYFGLAHYGSIYGVGLSAFALGAGIGPALTGWSFDHTGNYQVALFIGAMLFTTGAGIVATLGRYPALPRK